MVRARLIPFAALDPAFNMAADEAILRLSPVPTLRLYGWDPPSLSLGRFQHGRVDLGLFDASPLPVVRRMTGGGAIVHWHELTYSLFLPLDHPAIRGIAPRASYAVVHTPIRAALSALGVEAAERMGPAPDSSGPDPVRCFDRTTPLDLVARGRKLVGSAQRRISGRMLQHGSIILEENPLQPGTASLRSLLGRKVTPEELSAHLVPAFERLVGTLEIAELDREEESLAQELQDSYVLTARSR